MESNKYPSTKQFIYLNFNLKKIIFSFLNPSDQRTIYWMNKKLRALLPDSPLRINIASLKKSFSYQFDESITGILELSNDTIPCFTTDGIKLLKFNRNSPKKSSRFKILSYFKSLFATPPLKLIKKIPIESDYLTFPLQQENENIIFRNGLKEIIISDKDFNIIQRLEESIDIFSFCNLCELSFAVGLGDGVIKIYSRNSDTNKYEMTKEYKPHSTKVCTLLYLPKKDYLLSASYDKTIHVLNLSDGRTIKRLVSHAYGVTSFLQLNDETFATGNLRGKIKIWSIKSDIEYVTTIMAHNSFGNYLHLNLLGNEFMISRKGDEFKIWDLKNYESMNFYKEDSDIIKLIVTENYDIVTATKNNQVNVWKVSI
jgi:hypothetical protein